MKTYLYNTLIVSLTVLAPIKPVLITVGILIVGDMITGMWAAKRRNEKISSAAMRRTVSKMVIYQFAVISGFLLEKYLLSDTIPVSKLVAGAIGMVEFKSVLENSSSILGQDVFKMVIQKLGSKNDKKD
jgi:hypothetical protein